VSLIPDPVLTEYIGRRVTISGQSWRLRVSRKLTLSYPRSFKISKILVSKWPNLRTSSGRPAPLSTWEIFTPLGPRVWTPCQGLLSKHLNSASVGSIILQKVAPYFVIVTQWPNQIWRLSHAQLKKRWSVKVWTSADTCRSQQPQGSGELAWTYSKKSIHQTMVLSSQ